MEIQTKSRKNGRTIEFNHSMIRLLSEYKEVFVATLNEKTALKTFNNVNELFKEQNLFDLQYEFFYNNDDNKKFQGIKIFYL